MRHVRLFFYWLLQDPPLLLLILACVLFCIGIFMSDSQCCRCCAAKQ